jgi:hypothetical protein
MGTLIYNAVTQAIMWFIGYIQAQGAAALDIVISFLDAIIGTAIGNPSPDVSILGPYLEMIEVWVPVTYGVGLMQSYLAIAGVFATVRLVIRFIVG